MNRRSPGTLVVLTGPVGIGKSTTANAAARIIRSRGIKVASIDLDQIYCMIRQRDGFDDQKTWLSARLATAALADHLLENDISVVIVEGGFLTESEQMELVEALRAKPRIEIVTLHAPFTTVHARVTADTDPGRVASKIPAILKQLYDEYEVARPFLQRTTKVIEVQDYSVEQVALQVAGVVKCGN